MADLTHISVVQLDQQHKAVKIGPRNLVKAIVTVLFLSVLAVAQTPSISSISPTSGWATTSVYAGTAVSINGSNFGNTQGTSTVTFNGTAASSITSWTANSITAAIVPSAATTGNVVVTVGGVASNG